MVDDRRVVSVWAHRTREAVGVFAEPDALEAAVDRLEASGFHRANISVLGTELARFISAAWLALPQWPHVAARWRSRRST